MKCCPRLKLLEAKEIVYFRVNRNFNKKIKFLIIVIVILFVVSFKMIIFKKKNNNFEA